MPASAAGWKGVFGALFVCSWAGNQFSPMLLMYEDVRGYGDATVNAFLGVYVLGLAPALLVAGALSDRHGRRPVMFAGTLLAMAASAVLALGGVGALGPVPIFLGRLLSGVTVGTAMAVGTSWLKELSQVPFDRSADAGSGARRASLAFTLGSGVGALVAGSLAQWGPWPEVLPYLVHLVVTAPFVVLVRRVQETSTGGGVPGPLRARLRFPAAGHRRFTRVVLVVAPWIFAAAALSYGYAPVLLREQTGDLGVAYATLLTVVALGVAAVVQPAAKRLDAVDSARGLMVAVVVLTLAVAAVGAAVTAGSLWWGVAAAAVAGAGIGVGLSSGLLEVQRIAGPRELAGLTGVFYAVAYAGFLLPALMAAVTPPFSTAALFGVLLVLGAVSVVVVVANSRRHLPAGPHKASS
ncbi:MFS transporter [Isoptericola hypogeus]|uniref:MFS transporter n=1 Tax=Isoptericola hypogeus TaxID=300179 RepID=A0ABP4V270_9MICO